MEDQPLQVVGSSRLLVEKLDEKRVMLLDGIRQSGVRDESPEGGYQKVECQALRVRPDPGKRLFQQGQEVVAAIVETKVSDRGAGKGHRGTSGGHMQAHVRGVDRWGTGT